nr:hypothetical protein [Tanacetum cinerariifolium]
MKGRCLGADMGMKGGGFGSEIAAKKGFGVETAAKRDDDVLPAKHKSQIMIMHYNSTYSSGTSTAVLINGFHTPKVGSQIVIDSVLSIGLMAHNNSPRHPPS